MRKNLNLFLCCILAIFCFSTGQAMAVTIHGEAAYTDDDVQVCIYADIDVAEALRSFGVRLMYNPTELTYDGSKTSKNEAVWYLGDGSDNEPYKDPEDVEDGSNRAVVIIGGILDTGDTAHKVSGDRVLLGTVWFTRPGSSGPLASPLSLDYGEVSPYANFVVGPEETDVLDGSVIFEAVEVHERGDANGDNVITNSDMFQVKQLILDNIFKCYADCNKDGVITNSDMFCIKDMI